MDNTHTKNPWDTVNAISSGKIKEVIWCFKSSREELMVEMASSNLLMNKVDWLSINLTMQEEKLLEAEAEDLYYKKTRYSL